MKQNDTFNQSRCQNQTLDPSQNQTLDPSQNQTLDPSQNQTLDPSQNQTLDPSQNQNLDPSQNQNLDLNQIQSQNPMNCGQKKPEPPVLQTAVSVDAEQLDEEQLEAVAEALVFSAGDSIALVHIAQTLSVEIAQAQTIMEHLAARYDEEKRGIRLIQVGKAWQMVSRPEYYPFIQKMFTAKAATIRMTDTQLETLSIIAYRQPITKLEIEEIRGVHSDSMVNRLVEYGLIEEKGRLKAPGRPIQFGTTEIFLKYFGLQNLEMLPHYQEMQKPVQDGTADAVTANSQEDPIQT